MRPIFLLIAAGFLACAPAGAETPAAPSTYAAMRFAKVNMHAGPGQQYPVIWTYQRKNLPVQIVAEYDVWKKISDPDGTVGWVESTMLTDKRTVMVTKAKRTLRQDPQDLSPAVAMADPGAIAKVIACTPGWCHVKFDDYQGWLKEAEVWGTTPNESFEIKK